MALAHGYALPFEALRRTGVLAQNTADATIRATADGATKEAAGSCLDARALEVQQRTVVQPSILVVPQLTRNGVVLNQLPDTRTNFIQNNTMTGATGSVAPTTWSVVAPPLGITIGYSASGQTTAADGTLVDYIDVTVSGTALTSGNFNLRPEPVTSTVSGNLLFASGMTYTASFYMSLLSGSVSGVSPNYQIQEVSGTTFVSGTSLDLSAITSNLTRYSVTRPIAGTGGADRIRTRYGHAIASGQVLNYTIRIASPQLEKGSVATPVIRTASGFVSVDMLGVARDGAPPDFTFTRATTATRVNASGLIESVASGVLRLDYPVTGGCPAGLIEPSAQNLVPSGLVFNSAAGVLYDTAVSDSPAVSINSARITKNEASGTIRYAWQNCSTSALAGSTTYTISRFFKYDGVDFATSMEYNNIAQWGGTAWNQVINIASSGVTLGTSTSCTGSVENYGNGWYRVAVRITTGASPSGSPVTYLMRLPAALSTGQGFLTALPQLETGAIPTSYIPTTTGSATRAAEVCTVSGVSGYIGQTEGTIYAEFEIRSDSTTRRLFGLSDGTQSNRVFLYYTSNALRAQIQSTDISLGNPAAGYHKVAFAYQQSGVSGTLFASLDGGAVVSGTAGTFPSALKEVFFGKREDSADTQQWNARIRAAALYTTRLTDAQLAELTRL
jgi:hypothetical protein